MTELTKLHTFVLGFILAGSVAFAAGADEVKTPEVGQSDQNMSVEEATDNFVEDAGKVGDKAKEIGSDIAEGAEDAYDASKEAVQNATE